MGGGGTQCGGTMNITASAGSGGAGIRWTDNNSTVSSRSVGTGTYYAVTTSAAGCESGTASVAVTIIPATAPGSTVDFTAFNPCASAATGTVWYLTDTREAGYNQTYKVKKLQDGRIWMVQNLKFGNKCNKTAFSGSTGNQTGSKLTSISGYIYGDCRNNTQSGAGYLYDWAAAIQKAGAYYGTTTNPGCSGVGGGTTDANPGACQGICPAGWHIPTGNTTGEFYDLHTNYGRGCSTSNDDCWDANSTWEGALSGYGDVSGTLRNQGNGASYWSSTYFNSNDAYNLDYFTNTNAYPGTYHNMKDCGFSVRCVRNY
jgi:uncharacterized protein (TIGR02145 family)